MILLRNLNYVCCFQRTEYQSDEELYKTLFILLGSFLLIVIWLLIITLAVLCRKKSQNEYNFTTDDENDEREKEDVLQEPGKYESKDHQDDNHYRDDIPEKEIVNDPNAPDVIQTVKLWYV